MAALHPHTFPRLLLRRLCDGDDDLDDLAVLLRGRVSKNALHLRIIRDLAVDTPGTEQFQDHLTTLATLQRKYPAEVADVLAGPHFGAWAAHCVRRLASDHRSYDEVPLAVDLGHLGCFVGAAAIRAGADVTVTVPVRDGAVIVPAAGRVPVLTSPTPGWAKLFCRAGRVRVEAAGLTMTGWRPLATINGVLASGVRWGVSVDAADPYLGFVRQARADAVDLPRWSRNFRSA